MFEYQYILVFDQGIISSCVIVFDYQGNMKGVGQQEFWQYFFKFGWVEYDVNEIWSIQIGVVQQVLSNVGICVFDFVVIGIINQCEMIFIWDCVIGKFIYYVIVW